MLDESDAAFRLPEGGGGSLMPGRPQRVDGPRPAIDPPAPPQDGERRSYPSTYRTLTRDDVLDILRERGPSTRHQMFEHVFGPSHLSACVNPSSYAHDAVTELGKIGQIVKKGREGRSDLWTLADAPAPPPAGLFARVAAATTAETSSTDEGLDRRSQARIFVEDVVLPQLAIPLHDSDAAEALVADIFAEPHAPLPDAALVAGWRADLADLAYASSEDLRSVRFAGLDVPKAEAAWNEIVVGYALQPSEHGIALRIVVDALSGADRPLDYGRAWVGDAFAQLRMPPVEAEEMSAMELETPAQEASAPSAAPPADAQPSPATHPRVATPRPPRIRRAPAPSAATRSAPSQPIRPGVSEALKAKALVEFTSDSPAGQLSVRYAPMIRQAFDAGVSPEEIAGRLVAEGGIPIPAEMAVLLIRRVCACAR